MHYYCVRCTERSSSSIIVSTDSGPIGCSEFKISSFIRLETNLLGFQPSLEPTVLKYPAENPPSNAP